MRIRVILYGRLKQDAGVKTLDLVLDNLALDGPATVGAAVEHLTARYPALRAQLGSVAYAVGAALVGAEQPLRDGDELGLLPPVSGG